MVRIEVFLTFKWVIRSSSRPPHCLIFIRLKHLIWIESTQPLLKNAGAQIDFMQSYVTDISGFKIGWKNCLHFFSSCLHNTEFCLHSVWNSCYINKTRARTSHFRLADSRAFEPMEPRCLMILSNEMLCNIKRIKHLKGDEPSQSSSPSAVFVGGNRGLRGSFRFRVVSQLAI